MKANVSETIGRETEYKFFSDLFNNVTRDGFPFILKLLFFF